MVELLDFKHIYRLTEKSKDAKNLLVLRYPLY